MQIKCNGRMLILSNGYLRQQGRTYCAELTEYTVGGRVPGAGSGPSHQPHCWSTGFTNRKEEVYEDSGQLKEMTNWRLLIGIMSDHASGAPWHHETKLRTCCASASQ